MRRTTMMVMEEEEEEEEGRAGLSEVHVVEVGLG